MKTQKTNNDKKKSKNANPLPHCGVFQKTAERMRNCCQSEGGALDCWSMMRRMMECNKEGESGKTQGTEKPPKRGKNG